MVASSGPNRHPSSSAGSQWVLTLKMFVHRAPVDAALGSALSRCVGFGYAACVWCQQHATRDCQLSQSVLPLLLCPSPHLPVLHRTHFLVPALAYPSVS